MRQRKSGGRAVVSSYLKIENIKFALFLISSLRIIESTYIIKNSSKIFTPNFSHFTFEKPIFMPTDF